MNKLTRRISLAAAAACLAGSALLMLGGLGAWHPWEYAAGNFLALTQGFFALWISASAVGSDTVRFFVRGLGFHTVRIAAVLGILVLVRLSGFGALFPFLATVLWGYFVFMAAEVMNLHLGSQPAQGTSPPRARGTWQGQ